MVLAVAPNLIDLDEMRIQRANFSYQGTPIISLEEIATKT
jgi:hypothetical protein